MRLCLHSPFVYGDFLQVSIDFCALLCYSIYSKDERSIFNEKQSRKIESYFFPVYIRALLCGLLLWCRKKMTARV